jgi:hypothetical protein
MRFLDTGEFSAGEMRCRRHDAPRVARWAHAAPLARERDQEVVPALSAPRPGKASGEDAAVEVAAELPLHMRRRRPGVIVALATVGEPGLEVLLDAATEHALALPTRLVSPRCALLGLARAGHACPLVERGGSTAGGR